MHSRPPELFCHGDEENECHACMGRHSTTADQSEIREAYLVSVMATRRMNAMLAWADIRRPLIRARFAKRISSLSWRRGKCTQFCCPIHYCPDLEDFIAPNVEKM